MDLIDAFVILRNHTDAGTEARAALDYLDNYIYAQATEVERWRGLGVAPETARLCVAAIHAEAAFQAARAALARYWQGVSLDNWQSDEADALSAAKHKAEDEARRTRKAALAALVAEMQAAGGEG